jgi:hypothetical protein
MTIDNGAHICVAQNRSALSTLQIKEADGKLWSPSRLTVDSGRDLA